MKLLTFVAENQEQWGVLLNNPKNGEDYVLLPSKVQGLLPAICSGTSAFFLTVPQWMPDNRWPDTLTGFLQLEERGMQILQELYHFASRYLLEQDQYFLVNCSYPLSQVTLKAPIPEPRLYWGLVQNTTSFARNQPNRFHANLYPQGHQRPCTCAVGAGEAVRVLKKTRLLNFNVEFGIIIGKEGRDIPPQKALNYIAGFTNVIDVAKDDLFQGYDHEVKRTGGDFFIDATASWGGKKMDTCCPMGPYLVTRDEILNPYNLLGYTRQNSMLRDRAHTSAQLLGYERTIAFYSSFATLYPGDVIHLGTVGVDGMPFDISSLPQEDLGTFEGEFEGLGNLMVPVTRIEKEWGMQGKYDWAPPLVKKLFLQNKSSIEAPDCYQLSDTRSFWICYANYRQCMQVEQMLPIRDMPRFLNNPASALGISGSHCTLANRATNLILSAEVCLVVKKIAHCVPLEHASDYILGCSPMAAISDSSFQESILEPATMQERSLPHVYARWGDGYNFILSTPSAKDFSAGQTLCLSVNGKQYDLSMDDYICNGEFMLSHISQYVTLLPGDVISLGRLEQVVPISAEAAERGVTGSLCIEGMGTVNFSFGKTKLKCKNTIPL